MHISNCYVIVMPGDNLMKNIIGNESCYGCGACSLVCPKGCLEMVSDKEGVVYPRISKFGVCINCGECKAHCPSFVELRDEAYYGLQKDWCSVYAANNKDNGIRMKSSSGGIFSLFAECILNDGGYVCGAIFDRKFAVRHILVHSKEQLYRIMGSKYVQSDITDVLLHIKELLESGEKVLFSGTPCQVAGLRAYLGKKYDTLLCIEVICHGSPSPLVWKDYFDMKERDKGSIQSISFREKSKSWTSYLVEIVYANGEREKKNFGDNIFMKGFLADFFLRKTCYSCGYKGKCSVADIQLGDCWGAQEICPGLDDDKGTSVVIIKSEKGMKYYNMIEDRISHMAVLYDDVVKYNPSVEYSSDKLNDRIEFFEEYERLGLYKAICNMMKG